MQLTKTLCHQSNLTFMSEVFSCLKMKVNHKRSKLLVKLVKSSVLLYDKIIAQAGDCETVCFGHELIFLALSRL